MRSDPRAERARCLARLPDAGKENIAIFARAPRPCGSTAPRPQCAPTLLPSMRPLRHAAPVQRASPARRYARQSHRRFADVPIFLRRRLRQRLAFRPSRGARGRRRGAGVHRSGGGHAGGADLAAGPRRLERKALRAAGAHRALHRRARRGRRDSARPRRPQGEHLSAVVGRRRRARSGGRLAPGRAERDRLQRALRDAGGTEPRGASRRCSRRSPPPPAAPTRRASASSRFTPRTATWRTSFCRR